MTTKDQVFQALKSRRWVSSSELEAISPSATRRARELREQYEVKTRTVDGEYQYRIAGRK